DVQGIADHAAWKEGRHAIEMSGKHNGRRCGRWRRDDVEPRAVDRLLGNGVPAAAQVVGDAAPDCPFTPRRGVDVDERASQPDDVDVCSHTAILLTAFSPQRTQRTPSKPSTTILLPRKYEILCVLGVLCG